jgi:hypothetical protein
MRLQKPGKSPADKSEETELTETEMTEEEEQQREQAEELEKNVAQTLAAMQERIQDPATSAKQRQELEQKARELQEFLDQMKQNPLPPDQWSQIAESDQMKAILKALARGDDLPDEQWNKLLSTLGDGLWQVGGRTLPEDYRKSIEQYQERIRRLVNTADPEE